MKTFFGLTITALLAACNPPPQQVVVQDSMRPTFSAAVPLEGVLRYEMD